MFINNVDNNFNVTERSYFNKFQQAQKKWTKPGDCEVKPHEYFVSSHPGEDRDTDSEDEKEEQVEQLPTPIQDEDVELQEDVEMQEDPRNDERQEVCDTGEVENDE